MDWVQKEKGCGIGGKKSRSKFRRRKREVGEGWDPGALDGGGRKEYFKSFGGKRNRWRVGEEGE